MEDHELETLWKESNRLLAESRVLNMQTWVVNRQTFEWLQTRKVHSGLRPMGAFKGWAVLLGVAWGSFLGVLVLGDHGRHPWFTGSIAALFLFNVYAIAAYLWQRALIRQFDYTDKIVETQKKLAALQASTVKTTRILFLQTPFYATWFWNDRFMESTGFWTIAVPVTLLLTLGAFWLYRNISLANADKKWFRLLFSGIEWKPILRAMEYVREIEAFKD